MYEFPADNCLHRGINLQDYFTSTFYNVDLRKYNFIYDCWLTVLNRIKILII